MVKKNNRQRQKILIQRLFLPFLLNILKGNPLLYRTIKIDKNLSRR